MAARNAGAPAAKPATAKVQSPSQRAAQVRLVAFDVDGVLTDGRLYFGNRGETMKAFDVRDGFGIRLLRQVGIELAVITGRRSGIVTARARDLGITQVLQGQDDKRSALQRIAAGVGVAPQECAYMGDDWIDLSVLAFAGFAAAPADAMPEVRERAHWIAPSPGGRGAVRDLAQFVLQAQGRLEPLLREWV